MINTPHLLAGASIGSEIHNPWIVAIAAIISHFILDSVPHAEYNIDGVKDGKIDKRFIKDFVKILLDLFFGLTLIVLFAYKSPYFNYIIEGALFGIFPDFLLFITYIFPLKLLKTIAEFHYKIHWFLGKKISGNILVMSQVIFSAVFILLLIEH